MNRGKFNKIILRPAKAYFPEALGQLASDGLYDILNEKNFFHGFFKKMGDLERQKHRRSVVSFFDGNDGLARHSDCFRQLFLSSPRIVSKRVYFICDSFFHMRYWYEVFLLYHMEYCKVNLTSCIRILS